MFAYLHPFPKGIIIGDRQNEQENREKTTQKKSNNGNDNNKKRKKNKKKKQGVTGGSERCGGSVEQHWSLPVCRRQAPCINFSSFLSPRSLILRSTEHSNHIVFNFQCTISCKLFLCLHATTRLLSTISG